MLFEVFLWTVDFQYQFTQLFGRYGISLSWSILKLIFRCIWWLCVKSTKSKKPQDIELVLLEKEISYIHSPDDAFNTDEDYELITIHKSR